MVMPAAEAGLQRGTLVMPAASQSVSCSSCWFRSCASWSPTRRRRVPSKRLLSFPSLETAVLPRASQSRFTKPVRRRRLQRQTLASTTGAAIIENGKITKPCPKNECQMLRADPKIFPWKK